MGTTTWGSVATDRAVASHIARVLTCLALVISVATGTAVAQEFSAAEQWSAAALLLGGAALEDRRIRDAFPGQREGLAGRVAAVVEPLGRARTVYAELATSYVAGRLLGKSGWVDATEHVAAAYVAADAVTALLKGAVGRHRPSDGRGPERVWPGLKAHSDWDSFPSGHSTHAFAIATAVAMESGNRWITAASYSAAGLVGASRVYDRAHWTSDVVAGALIGTEASRLVVGWLKRRAAVGDSSATAPRLRVAGPVVEFVVPVNW